MLKTVPPEETAAYSTRGDGGTVGQGEGITETDTHRDSLHVSLLNESVREQEARRIRYQRYPFLVVAGTICCQLLASVLTAALVGYPMPSLIGVLFGGAVMALFYLLLFGGQVPAQERQREAALSLAQVAPTGPRTLAVLLDTLPILPVRSSVALSCQWPELGNLFPPLTAALWNAGDDLPLILDGTRRARLRGTLNALWNGRGELPSDSADFCAAAIKALTLTGDIKSVSLFRRIAGQDWLQRIFGAKTAGNNRLFVQSLAIDCLPLLLERNRQQHENLKRLRGLLHTKKGEIDGAAVGTLLENLGEERARVTLYDYLRVTSRPPLGPPRIFGPLYTYYGLTWLFVYLTEKWLANYHGRITKPRRQVLSQQIDRWGDVRLLGTVLSTVDKNKNLRVSPSTIAKLLYAVTPGDGIYFTPGQRLVLEKIVWERFIQGNLSAFSTDLTAAAITALGMVGDKRSLFVISALQGCNRMDDAALRSVMLDATRRINDANVRR